MNSKEKLRKLLEDERLNWHQLPGDTADLIAALSGDRILPEREKQEDKVDMCKAIQDMIEEGKAEGLKEGKAEGLKEGKMELLRQIVENGFSQGLSLEEISRLSGYPAEFIQKMASQPVSV